MTHQKIDSKPHLSTQSSSSSVATLVSASSRLDAIQKALLSVRANDLKRWNVDLGKRHTGSNSEKARLYPTFALIRAIVLITRGLISTFLLNPSIILTDPVGSIFLGSIRFLWLFSMLWFGQLLLSFGRLIGLGAVVDQARQEYGMGRSVCNWSNATMFDAEVVAKGKLILSAPPPPNRRYDFESTQKDLLVPATKVSFFDINLARTMLLMSSALYERSDELVEKAVRDSTFAETLLLQSEQAIHEIVEQWKGIQFTSISDLTSISGSFCGAFYSNSIEENGDPWIVVVFKGASPNNLSDWICDTTFNKEAANDYLYGSVNQGLYTSLFPSPGVPVPTVSYFRILECTNAISRVLHSETGKRVNIFVTGHSLGAGIASLFYARLLEEEKVLSSAHSVLRDAFLFGTPCVGDGEFVGGVDKLLNRYENSSKNIWRVSNNADLVAISPPGIAGRRADRLALSKDSLLNYGPIGTEVHLENDFPFYHIHPWTYDSATEILVVEKGGDASVRSKSEEGERKEEIKSNMRNPIAIFESVARFVIPSLMEHAPTSYYAALAKIQGSDYPSAQGSPFFSNNESASS